MAGKRNFSNEVEATSPEVLSFAIVAHYFIVLVLTAIVWAVMGLIRGEPFHFPDVFLGGITVNIVVTTVRLFIRLWNSVE